ncbi:MAG: hypothetical protein II737_08405, partial [Mailhella sp.]|nr:hypothetical protein [Mailhella sp.]
MNDMVSILELLDGQEYGPLRHLRDDVTEMDASLRKLMDRGLTPDEMRVAQSMRAAVQSASAILEKL